MNFCSLLLSLVVLPLVSFAQQDYVPNEVLVKFKPGPVHQKLGMIMSKMGSKIELLEAFRESESYHFKINEENLQLKAGADSVLQIIEELKLNPEVEYAEPNWILSKFEEVQSAGDFLSEYTSIQIENAWTNAISLAGQPHRPIIAVIDSGVDFNHVVFTTTGAIWNNTAEIANDGIDNDGNGFIDDTRGWNFITNSKNSGDDNGHGTHVAGIVLGATQNILPDNVTKFLEPAKIQIMPLKFLSATGSGATSDAIRAIYYAVNNGAQVINNSWGGSSYSQALHDALKYAYDNRVTIVTAAGNSSKNNDVVSMYPANYPVPGQITVAATDDYDQLSGFSNYGVSLVHVGSPGSFIFSTSRNNSFQTLSGTSMAAPLVAGLAGLVLREAPNLTGFQIKNLIMNTGNSVASLAGKVQSGKRVNLNASVLAATSEFSTAAAQPVYKAENLSGQGSREVASEASAGGCGLVNGFNTSIPPLKDRMMMMLFLLAPLGVWLFVRAQKQAPSSEDGKNRRSFERFVMDSNIKIKVGDRELVANMKTISLGGASFQADTLLEKGGLITLQISDPSGTEQMSVQGHIVWSEENKSYGVQFMDVKEGMKASLESMTQGLPKAS